MVKGGATSVDASNNNFGDPAGGVVKKLRVDFQINGQAGSKTVNEQETINLAVTTVPPVRGPDGGVTVVTVGAGGRGVTGSDSGDAEGESPYWFVPVTVNV